MQIPTYNEKEFMNSRQKNIHQAATGKYIHNLVKRGAFVAGANWADKNPQCPWVSVNERLPELDPTQHTKKKNMSVAVLIHDIDCMYDRLGQAFAPSVARFDYDRKDWLYVELGCYCNELELGAEITHWMPIPELKK